MVADSRFRTSLGGWRKVRRGLRVVRCARAVLQRVSMPRALITGITGQDGLYLSELLLGKEYEVYGLIRGQNNPKRDLVERAVPGVRVAADARQDGPFW